jgi:hypothetical protein
LDGVDDVGGAERNIKVGNVVPVEKCGVVRGDAHAEDADVIIFKDEMMVGSFGRGTAVGAWASRENAKRSRSEQRNSFTCDLRRKQTHTEKKDGEINSPLQEQSLPG